MVATDFFRLNIKYPDSQVYADAPALRAAGTAQVTAQVTPQVTRQVPDKYPTSTRQTAQSFTEIPSHPQGAAYSAGQRFIENE